MLSRDSAKYGYLENREDDSVDFIRPDDKDGRFARQKPDGLYGRVLDRQFSNRRAGMNEKSGHLDRETERWAINHGMTR